RIISIAGIFMILYGSQELNRLYWYDYKTYVADRDMAFRLAEDLEKITGNIKNTPVLLMGFPHQVLSRYGDRGEFQGWGAHPGFNGAIENVDTSYFISCRIYIYDFEYEQTRMLHFMNQIARTNFQPAVGYDRDKVQRKLATMEAWPREGSILDMGDYYLVKLGDSSLEHYVMSESDFIEKFDKHRNNLVYHAELHIAGSQNGKNFEIPTLLGRSALGVAYIENNESDGCITQFALLSPTHQYTMYTTPLPSPQLNDAKYDFSGFVSYSVPSDSIEKGKHEAAIIIRNSRDSFVHRTGQIIEIQ
ncbi:MAG: hypothetical protein IJ597_05290, partial [Synergistaceae bacterium]|nr:hypothetical protein [Synergistaceae bacterium]